MSLIKIVISVSMLVAPAILAGGSYLLTHIHSGEDNV